MKRCRALLALLGSSCIVAFWADRTLLFQSHVDQNFDELDTIAQSLVCFETVTIAILRKWPTVLLSNTNKVICKPRVWRLIIGEALHLVPMDGCSESCFMLFHIIWQTVWFLKMNQRSPKTSSLIVLRSMDTFFIEVGGFFWMRGSSFKELFMPYMIPGTALQRSLFTANFLVEPSNYHTSTSTW